uniref:Uncharacterized protein n=1 Tax=Onchocerca volvulus TaxID=6282 RepID=A0A8R1XQR6_ONCVO
MVGASCVRFLFAKFKFLTQATDSKLSHSYPNNRNECNELRNMIETFYRETFSRDEIEENESKIKSMELFVNNRKKETGNVFQISHENLPSLAHLDYFFFDFLCLQKFSLQIFLSKKIKIYYVLIM